MSEQTKKTQTPEIDESFLALTEAQAQNVILHTLATRGPSDKPFLLRVLRYLDSALMEHAMIENVLSGTLAIVGFSPDGEAHFQITPQGEREVEAMGERASLEGAVDGK